jgi:glycolate oxidase FAD binding subunit
MDTERSTAPALRDALTSACPSLSEGSASDAVAGVVPSFVASPSSTAEASALMRAAASAGLAVVPRGAGTGLSWGAPPARCDLVVDLRSMDQVTEHAAGDLVARVQAGATIGQVAAVLASAGQQLALDAPADATVGGVVATGTAGPRRFRYGAPRDLLIGLTVVRADGVIAHSGGKVVKNVAGYDLGKLFSGSQGTLGLITEATFRLHPRPAAVAWVTGEFEPADRAGAVAAVASAARSALVPSAVELDWPGGSQRPLRVGVLLEGTSSGVAERAKQLSELLASAGGSAAVADVPPARWGQLPSAMSSRGGLGAPGSGVSPGSRVSPRASTVVRVSFWVSSLGAVLEALAAAGADAGVRPAVSGPAGAGALYACLDRSASDDEAARFVTVLRERVGAALGPRGGVLVLAAPPPVLEAVSATGTIPGAALMRAVKDQFDPGHRMFPGRFAGGD